MRRRERWFTEGAAALRRALAPIGGGAALPPTGEFYGCPLCLRAYGRDALEAGYLTEEHVPPKWAGGRPLLLTCQPCNNRAGSELDAQAAHREAQHDFLAGRAPDRAHPAEFTVGDATTRVNAHHGSDFLALFAVPKANDPRDLDAMDRALRALAAGEASDGRMGLRLTQRVAVVRARLSWVRAAYLAAFAALGWRYASLPQLAPVRAQLADPAADLLPPLAMVDPDAPPDQRRLFLVQQPHALRSLAAVLGRYAVLLPGLEDPQPVEDLAAALGRVPELPTSPGRRALRWTGKDLAWPTEPVYALDQEAAPGDRAG